MRLVKQGRVAQMREALASDEVLVVLNRHELALMNNAANETLEALDDWEFETRVGGSRAEVKALLHEIGAVSQQASLRW